MISEAEIELLNEYYDSQKVKVSNGKELCSISLLERMLVAEMYSIVVDIRRLLLAGCNDSRDNSAECGSDSNDESPDT